MFCFAPRFHAGLRFAVENPERVARLVVLNTGIGARAPNEEWLLGVWEGAHRDILIDGDATSCEFFREDGRVRWRMTRQTTLFRQGPVTLSAAGFYKMSHEFRKDTPPKTKIYQ